MATHDDPPAENPYAPPEEPVGRWQAPEEPSTGAAKSGVPKVFGVLSVTFASLLLLLGLLGSCSGLFGQSMLEVTQKLPAKGESATRARRMMVHAAEIYFWTGIESSVLSVMSGLLLALGIGQMRYRSWARIWTVRWAVGALAVVAALLALSLLVLAPAYEQMFRVSADAGGMTPDATQQASTMMGATLGVMQLLLLAPYPILLLVFFTRPRIRAAMNR